MLHKPVRRHFVRRRIVVGGLDHQFQADLNLSTLFERRSCGILCVTHNEDIKASIMERFNRTLNESLWRYFTRNNTLRYVEALSKLVRAYNHSYHRSIKRAPADVSATNQEEVWQTLYGQAHDTLNKGHRRPKLKEGDWVRISNARRTFKKVTSLLGEKSCLPSVESKKQVLSLMCSKRITEMNWGAPFTKKKSKKWEIKRCIALKQCSNFVGEWADNESI